MLVLDLVNIDPQHYTTNFYLNPPKTLTSAKFLNLEISHSPNFTAKLQNIWSLRTPILIRFFLGLLSSHFTNAYLVSLVSKRLSDFTTSCISLFFKVLLYRSRHKVQSCGDLEQTEALGNNNHVKAKKFCITATLLRTGQKIGRYFLQCHVPCNHTKCMELFRFPTYTMPKSSFCRLEN